MKINITVDESIEAGIRRVIEAELGKVSIQITKSGGQYAVTVDPAVSVLSAQATRMQAGIQTLFDQKKLIATISTE